ncbi:MAG: hypothetical protein JWQ96_3469 [Segetibacter sp.]|nr:hypothetical protein [Segetibacter sp.]
MDSSSAENIKPLLFISHKHVDSLIADTIRQFITRSTAGNVDVFQSSSDIAEAPKAGRSLTKQLRETLWKANVVILLYTDQDQDWNYCMWEIGVASHPQSPEARIILFNCNTTAPGVFADQVSVNLRALADIMKFTKDFLTSPDFFPGYGKAITAFDDNDEAVTTAAAEFFEKLKAVLPELPPPFSVDWPAFPFLQLEMKEKDAAIIKNAPTAERSKIATEIILNECVISNADKYCEQLFGMPNFLPDMTLKQLAESWRECNQTSKSKWVEALCSQVTDGALWKFPKNVVELMQGVNDNNWFAPLMIRVRKIPAKATVQFDIYFYKFIVKEDKQAVEIPLPLSE